MRNIFLIGLFASWLLATVVRAEVPADAVWIDVRTPTEYSQGHLEQARNIPFDGIVVGVTSLKLSSDAPIYVYCASGGRAKVAKQSLEAAGYTNVTNAGGLEDARKLAEETTP